MTSLRCPDCAGDGCFVAQIGGWGEYGNAPVDEVRQCEFCTGRGVVSPSECAERLGLELFQSGLGGWYALCLGIRIHDGVFSSPESAAEFAISYADAAACRNLLMEAANG